MLRFISNVSGEAMCKSSNENICKQGQKESKTRGVGDLFIYFLSQINITQQTINVTETKSNHM